MNGAGVAAPLLDRPSAVRRLRMTLASALPRGMSLSHEEWLRRHRWMTGFLWIHVVALPLFGVRQGVPLLHGLADGAIVLAIAVTGLVFTGRRVRSTIVSVGLITCSALAVHLSGGVIEAHFHFFVIIVVLTLYEDWVPFLMSFAYVVAHHGLMGTLHPNLVYNHPDALAHPWKWAIIHGLFVGAAGAAAVVAWRLNEESRTHVIAASRRAEKSEAADELKSRFVAMASHELRTPLTSISGFARTLIDREDMLSAEQRRQFVTIIAEQSERLGDLIADLLTVSRIESGRIEPSVEEVRLEEVVRATLLELPPDALGLPTEVLCDADLQVCADRRHLQQILTNLIINAARYGRPPIRIHASSEHGSKDPSVVLRVCDNGDGVPPTFRPKLFERFTQADEAAGKHANGTGLGLSIVKGLVEAHRGEVWYEQNAPHGAVFCVRLRAPRIAAAAR